VLPADRRRVGEQRVWHGLALITEVLNRTCNPLMNKGPGF